LSVLVKIIYPIYWKSN